MSSVADDETENGNDLVMIFLCSEEARTRFRNFFQLFVGGDMQTDYKSLEGVANLLSTGNVDVYLSALNDKSGDPKIRGFLITEKATINVLVAFTLPCIDPNDRVPWLIAKMLRRVVPGDTATFRTTRLNKKMHPHFQRACAHVGLSYKTC